MTSRRRRLVLTVPLALALVACGPGGTTSPSASAPAASPPAETDVPSSDGSEIGQTDTEWGRIWDAVPAWFPRFPGSTLADDAGGGPASARYAIGNGDPEAIAAWMQAELETATFSTESMDGPFEDGGFVIESVGEAGCRIQTTIAPLGDLTFVTVRYGADCPVG